MGKKVKGRKRYIAPGTSGFLLGDLVHAADSAGALLTRIKRLYGWLWHRLRRQNLQSDAGNPRLLPALADADHRQAHRRWRFHPGFALLGGASPPKRRRPTGTYHLSFLSSDHLAHTPKE